LRIAVANIFYPDPHQVAALPGRRVASQRSQQFQGTAEYYTWSMRKIKFLGFMMNTETGGHYSRYDYSHADNQDVWFERSIPPAFLWWLAGIGSAAASIALLIVAQLVFLHKGRDPSSVRFIILRMYRFGNHRCSTQSTMVLFVIAGSHH
jgi:hypothetical protein